MDIENIIVETSSEIGRLESQLSALRKSLSSLREITGESTVERIMASGDPDGRYEGQDVGSAVRQFMQDRRVATREEIRKALDRGGITWGKYPKRQVALAIANKPKVYSLKGETVTLIQVR